MMGVSAVQTWALQKAELAEAATKKGGTAATIAATIAQKAFNAVAKANPYVLLATALKVANLFNHGNVLTKSETLKEVKSVVPVKDGNGRTLMYAVNYDDGYMLISARIGRI